MAAAAAAAVRVGVCIFLVFITYLALPGSSLFSWHPFLMSLAFTGLMSEAVSIFTRHSLASGCPHSTKITAHWALLAAAAAAHGLGYAAIYYTKESKNKPHLTSWHGLLGLATSILLWGQVTIGVVAKYPKVVEKFVSLRSIRSGHSLSGSLCFCLAMVCVCVSCWSDWFQGGAGKLGDFGVWCLWGVVSLHVVLLCVVCKRHVTRYVWK